MYRGSSINDVTRHILIKLLSNEISRFITLTGHKGKTHILPVQTILKYTRCVYLSIKNKLY